MRPFIKLAVVAVGTVFAFACGDTQGPVTTGEDAIRIADAYVSLKYPDPRRPTLTPKAYSNDRYWLVVYHLPEGAAGGAPTLVIDRSGEVLVSYSEQ